MATDLARLVVRLEAQNSQLLGKLDQANNRLARFERGARRSLTSFKRAIAGAFGAALGGGLLITAKNALDFADSIDKAAKAADLSADALQELRFAGDQLGITQTQVDEGFRRFARRLGEFANSGAGPAAKAFEELGINIRDAAGRLRPTEAVFNDVVRALEEVETTAQRGAYAAQLFGDDAGPKLRLLLDQGARGLENLRKEARDIGAVLDESVISNAVEAKDELAKLSRVVGAQVTQAFINLAPVIITASNAFLEFSGALRDFFKDTKDVSQLEAIDEAIKRVQDRIDLLTIRNKGVFAPFLPGQTQQNIAELEQLEQQLINLKEARDAIIKQGPGFKAKDIYNVSSPKKLPDGAGSQDKTKELADATAAEREFEEAVSASESAVKAENAAYQEWRATLRTNAQALREQINPMEELETRLTGIDELLRQGEISWDTYAEAVFDAQEDVSARFDEVKQKEKEVSQGALDMGFAFQSAFEDAVLEGQKLSDLLNALLKDIGKIAIRQLITAPLGTAVSGGLAGLFPGFASGGSFTVGGSSGTDRNLVAFMATKGEGVTVTPAGAPAAGGTVVNIVNNSGAPAQQSRRTGSNGREIIDIIIGTVSRDLSSNGTISQSLQSSFGLRRNSIMRA